MNNTSSSTSKVPKSADSFGKPSTRPVTSKAELIANERAAEQAVVQAEYEARAAEVGGATGVELVEYDAYIESARRESLRIRQVMIDGLAEWHRHDSEVELARTARELGIAQ